MLLSIKEFIKNKVFSTTGVFFLIFAAIFSVFLFSNSNVILSKFGFETTTNLKAELTRTQEELKTLQAINNNLNKQIEELNKVKEKETNVIVEYVEKKDSTKEKTNNIIKKKKEKVQETVDQISTTQSTENAKIIELQDKISEENIIALNEAFDTFFLKSKGD